MTFSETKVLEGKEDFLFLRNDSNKVLQQISGERNLTSGEISLWKKQIEYRDNVCKSFGAQYLYFIVPNKHCVYSQFLDEKYTVSETRAARKLEKAISRVFYPCDLLKNYQNLSYYKTDTHWNSTGCALAWNQISDILSLGFKFDLSKTKKQKIIGDLGNKLSPQRESVADELDIEIETEEFWNNELHNRGVVRIYKNRDDSLKRAIIFGDSFVNKHIQYIAAYFSELYFLNSNLFPLDMIKRLSPDVIITQTAERFIRKDIPTDEDLFVSLLCLMEKGKYASDNLYRFVRNDSNPFYPNDIYQAMKDVARQQIEFLGTVDSDSVSSFIENKKNKAPYDFSEYITDNSPSRIHYEQYLYYDHIGNQRNALKSITSAVSTCTYKHEYYYCFAKALDNCGQTKDAIRQMKSALSLDHKNLQYYLFLINLYAKVSDVESAKVVFCKAKSIYIDIQEPYYLWSMLYLANGDLDKAIAEFLYIVKQKDDSQSHLHVAKLYMAMSSFDHAKQHALSAIKIDSSNKESHDLLRQIVERKMNVDNRRDCVLSKQSSSNQQCCR